MPARCTHRTEAGRQARHVRRKRRIVVATVAAAVPLGDVVFGHYSRNTGEAFVLEAELGPNGIGAVTVTPACLDQYGRPEYVTGEAAATILERLKAISAKRDTVVGITGDIGAVIP